jgi:hypothetical protein
MEDMYCDGGHHYFVAEVIGNQSNGKAYVLAICTACGDLKSHEVGVGNSGDSLRLYLDEKKKKGQ